MTRRVVILGGGTGGTLVANRLRRMTDEASVDIVVVDRDDRHIYQPGLLFVPFGTTRPESLVRPRSAQLAKGVTYRLDTVDQVDLDARTVAMSSGDRLGYDVLVIATGAELMPEETEGLTGPGWLKNVFTFYSLDGASALARALDSFDGGRLAVNVVDMPIKCPVAPLEFAFLADAYFRRRGIRDRVELSLVTPLDGAFTKPIASATLGGMFEERGINLVTEYNTGEVDSSAGRLVSYDGREEDFDLAVVVPVHGGSAWVGRSDGLGDPLNFVPTDEQTLQSMARPEVFVLGDAADVRASKAGSVAHFEGHVLCENVRAHLAGEAPSARYDGHANCFIETGAGRALLIDFNYETEPMPGRYPGRIGLPLLAESRTNHVAKRLFEQFYWHVLLPGRDVPGIGADMPMAGKVPAPMPASSLAGKER
ncbi:MAG: NAD(P)/FAD-dependent oxidoreductase [Actinobacteria bacterium]|nr:NAD(P)/FAD-dependent oxidoreductase [Actinomycetota bacterium]